MSIYDFSVTTIEGKNTDLSQFRDHVLLIVNVASQCGFTGQYEGLENLYRQFQSQRFAVLGFPCNQFGFQEPGEDQEIKAFCQLKYQVTFPMYSKIFVNGPKTHPLYSYLKSEEKGLLGTESIKWNFTKFLVDRTGKVIRRYAPQIDPNTLGKDIQALL